ncbi:MAG: RNA ligase family protein [Candidatus Deferrimicrobiaceae bacterium]
MTIEAEQPQRLRSYGKIYAVGHSAVYGIFDDQVLVEEKVDGSQFSFGLRGGKLFARSRNVALDVDGADPAGMFDAALATVRLLRESLVDGWTYRSEYLRSPKHNTLPYDRIPIMHLALFDVDKGDQSYVSWVEKASIAEELGMEVVPKVFEGKIESLDQIHDLMQRKSFLGGAVVEGLVFKAYGRFGADGKTLMAKHVSEAFKETHSSDWAKRHPAPKDIKEELILMLRTPARWEKAVQHLRDAGLLENDPRDIGPLMKELQRDLIEECAEEMKERLFQWAKKDVARGASRGFPEWYKERLMARAFPDEGDQSP